MINREALIQEAKNRLVAAYDPEEIYLFGSYAWGTPDKESDLDFVIVLEQTDISFYERPYKAYDVLMDLAVPNDVIVWTRAEFDKRRGTVGSFTHKVATDGIKVYARS